MKILCSQWLPVVWRCLARSWLLPPWVADCLWVFLPSVTEKHALLDWDPVTDCHWRIFYLPSNSLEWTRSIGSHACPCLTVDVVCFGSWAVPFFHHTILFINLIRLILVPVLECYQWFAVLHLVVNPLLHSWRSLLTRFSQCTSPRGFMPIQSEGARAPSNV